MQDALDKIETLIAELSKSSADRTAHLDMAIGGLTTARDQIKAHLKKNAEKLKTENLKSDVSLSAHPVSISASQCVSVSEVLPQ